MSRIQSNRVIRYAQLEAALRPGVLDLPELRRRMLRWQCEPGNLDVLSSESGRRYVQLVRALELMQERGQSIDRDVPPAFTNDCERVACVCSLREALILSLRASLTEKVDRSSARELSAALDPTFLPPDEPAEWRAWYDQLRYQVSREDELVHQRLTWMMQFEGFLFAAFGIAVAGRDPMSHALREVLLVLVPIVGLGGAYAVRHGVRSAHRVLETLERAYLASLTLYKTRHVRPFGRHSEHRQIASAIFPWITLAAWALILLAELLMALTAFAG